MLSWLSKLLGSSKPAPDTEHDCIGEPVISFLKSLKENPKRYRVRSNYLNPTLSPEDYESRHNSGILVRHYGFREVFYTLTDRKTGNKFYVQAINGGLKSVLKLPFSLNGFEINAIAHAFQGFNKKANDRLTSMKKSSERRYKEGVERAEQYSRLEFAKQFKD